MSFNYLYYPGLGWAGLYIDNLLQTTKHSYGRIGIGPGLMGWASVFGSPTAMSLEQKMVGFSLIQNNSPVSTPPPNPHEEF